MQNTCDNCGDTDHNRNPSHGQDEQLNKQLDDSPNINNDIGNEEDGDEHKDDVGIFEWLTDYQNISHILARSKLFPQDYEFNCNACDHGGDDNGGHTGDDEYGKTRIKNGDEDERHATQKKQRQKVPVRRVLNLGCGNSLLGEYLLRPEERETSSLQDNAQVGRGGYDEVVNVDRDEMVLQSMQCRWGKYVEGNEEMHDKKMSFICMDFSQDVDDDGQCISLTNDTSESNGACHVKHDSSQDPEYFDLIVDKSTLDCALCSKENDAVGLLCLAYRYLKPPPPPQMNNIKEYKRRGGGGIYAVISFHPPNFLQPLLRNLPGASWDVEHFVVARNETFQSDISQSNSANNGEEEEKELTFAWSSGSFQPDEEYKRSVHVYLCQKQHPQCAARATTTSNANDEEKHRNGICKYLDRNAVKQHILDAHDRWFAEVNPLLTEERTNEITNAFQEKLESLKGINNCNDHAEDRLNAFHQNLPLEECYNLLFTEAEREHLSFEYFLQDWEAFYSSQQEASRLLRRDSMTLEIALAFLAEMQ